MTLGGLEHTYATVPEAARGDGVAINSTYASIATAATGTIEPNYAVNAGSGADPHAYVAYTDVAPASTSRYTPEPVFSTWAWFRPLSPPPPFPVRHPSPLTIPIRPSTLGPIEPPLASDPSNFSSRRPLP